MKEQIKKQLQHLKEKEDIKILLAVESGSRAWGFPSPDSDYDVRIIYLRKPEWYLSIDDKKDTIEYFHGKLLDIGGWDIRKTLRLLRKSNATPFEWAQSPIIYEEKRGFREQLMHLAREFFQPIHSLNHYRGIAKNSYNKLSAAGEIKLKTLFYIIRPILAGVWIIKNGTTPPMDIENLMKSIEDKSIINKIRALIKTKESVNEDYTYSLEPDIQKFIDNHFQELELIDSLEKKMIPETQILDSFYRELINKFY